MTRKREMNQMMMMTKFLKMTMWLMSLMQILLNILKVISAYDQLLAYFKASVFQYSNIFTHTS